MSLIHFLNVKNGDCTWIEHDGGHNTMIDVCNAKPVRLNKNLKMNLDEEYYGNHNRKNYPVNPVEYLKKFEVTNIFRFILTHPDMDHMDGIRYIFEEFAVTNFWDTKNNKVMDENSDWGRFDKKDWDFYQSIRNGTAEIKVLNLNNDAEGKYYNEDDKNGEGDGLHILAPSKDLVSEANEIGKYNDCSYVILYKTENRKIIFAGDSAEKTWDFIIKNYREKIENIDLLIAPHHGRRIKELSNSYLDIMKPKLTLFGNAESEYLDYSAWNNRNLPKITNNQASNIIAEIANGRMNIYCTYEKFAKEYNKYTLKNKKLDAWFLMSI